MKILDVVILLLYVVNAQKILSEEERNASQSSDYYYISRGEYMTADLAISGEPGDMFGDGECSVTLAYPIKTVAWWMFTFPVDTVFITNVEINYRYNTLRRFAGYSVYVSNSSISKTDGYLCYHHEGPGLPLAYQNVNCNHLGKYVIIYNERYKTVIYPHTWHTNYAILELCKVRIYGCYKGWWGSDCSIPSPATCVDRHCYPSNGSCVWGCDPVNCLNDICDTDTGMCTHGCKIGFRGDYCDKECELGKFGNNCTETCNCVNQTCEHMTGVCPPGGCQRGYTRLNCSVECSIGIYGYNCNQSCGGCLSNSCDKKQGVCTNTTGCKPGWQYVQSGLQKCDIECELGTFGNNCTETCNCVNQPCDHITGVCPPGGCLRGYTRSNCSTECSVGSFGYNCNQSCDGCLFNSCRTTLGYCLDQSGCKPGWQYVQSVQNKCDIECNDGYFGMNCEQQCHCRYGACIKAKGICPSKGCQRGWKGDTCSEECSDGDHGFDCVDRCNTCHSTLCERFEGNCTYGCVEGFKGHQCLVSVTSQSDEQSTTYHTLNIIYAVIGSISVTTLVCVTVFLVIWRYRRDKNTNGDINKQNRQSTSGYRNDAYTNDYTNIGDNNAESHYEATIPSAQEQPYDTI